MSTLNKELFIKRYGEDIWHRSAEDWREWCNLNQEASKTKARIRRLSNPEKEKMKHREIWSKGGKYYVKNLRDNRTGLRGERNKIRGRDGHRFRKYKRFFAQEANIHHEWIPGTSQYRGVALVEKNAHQHGIIDIIRILDGEITVLTEAELSRK